MLGLRGYKFISHSFPHTWPLLGTGHSTAHARLGKVCTEPSWTLTYNFLYLKGEAIVTQSRLIGWLSELCNVVRIWDTVKSKRLLDL